MRRPILTFMRKRHQPRYTSILFPDTEYTLGDKTFIYYLSSNATHRRIDCHYREVTKLTRDGRDRIALVK